MMPSRKEYPARLKALTELLRLKPMTAKAIAEALGCSKPVVYRRLAALRKCARLKIYEMTVRESVTGPHATAYGVR